MQAPQILQTHPDSNPNQTSTPQNTHQDIAHPTAMLSQAHVLQQMQDDQHPIFKDKLSHDYSSRLTPELLRTLCQDQTHHPIEDLLSEHLEETKSQLCEIELIAKFNFSCLPKRVTQWLNKQIEIYLKKHYDPSASQLSQLRLRNRGVLLGHLLFSIFELKNDEDMYANQIDSKIISLSDNDAVKLGTEIAVLVEKSIYEEQESKSKGLEDVSTYKQMFERMVSQFEEIGSQQIRKQYVWIRILQPWLDEIDDEFYLRTYNIDYGCKKKIYQCKYPQKDNHAQAKFLSSLNQITSKPHSKQVGYKMNSSGQRQLEQPCNTLTPCDSSSPQYSSEDDFDLQGLKGQVKFMSTSFIYKGNPKLYQRYFSDSQNEQEEVLPIEANLLHNHHQQGNLLPPIDDNLQVADAPNTPQLPTMDTSNPSQQMEGQHQRMLDNSFVIQQQQNIQNQEHNESEEKQVEQ